MGSGANGRWPADGPAASRVLRTLLFGVSASDPLTFAAVVVLLITVAARATYAPARRAARVDPLVAMRGQRR